MGARMCMGDLVPPFACHMLEWVRERDDPSLFLHPSLPVVGGIDWEN